LVLLLVAGCSGGSSGGPDGSTDTGTDSDGDTDTDGDGDADGDTDTDPGVLSCPGQTDAGPWEWEDQPAGEDCGPGCKQITFGKSVRLAEWDVWDDRLAFVDDETRRLWLVDMAEHKQLKVPAVNPELAPDPPLITNAFFWPTLYEDELLHGWYTTIGVPGMTSRQVVASFSEPSLRIIADWGGRHLDQFGDYVAYEGSYQGNDSDRRVFLSKKSEPCTTTVVADDFCVGCSIWEQAVVWVSDNGMFVYDIENAQLTNLSTDQYFRMWPRIHGRRIVYMDLRFGDNNPLGNWNHSAVFLYDLDTQQTTQIAGGDWIACYPDVHGDIVVWQDYRASDDPNNGYDFSGVEIWGYNLATQTEFQVTNIPGRAKQTPRVWGGYVYVDMVKPGGNAIYRFDLPEGAR
jgi:hypothetical protein